MSKTKKILGLVIGLTTLSGCGTLVPVLEAVAPSLEAGLANKGLNVNLDFAAMLEGVCLDPSSELATTLKGAPAGEALLPVLVPLCEETPES